MKKKLISTLLILTLLFLGVSSSSALSGTDVWKTSGYIEYEVNALQDYDREFYSDLINYPNYKIQDATLKTTFLGMSAGKMIYQLTSTSSTLDEMLGLSIYNSSKIDPKTGLDETGYWYGAFHETDDFEDGYEVSDIIFRDDYEDDYGSHSVSKKTKVSGGKKSVQFQINGKTKKIDVWDLTINDFNFTYELSGIEFRLEYKNLLWRISDRNGVLLTQNFLILAKLELEKVIMTINMTMNAVNINDVKIEENGGLIPGFELYLTIIPVMVGLIIRKKKSIEKTFMYIK
ncbi:MAG: hypothetical protein ACFFCQ_11245 [Promethearchaeota archaeon]